MGKARQRAYWRKVVPECFDDLGNMLPGKLGEVLTKLQEREGQQPPTVV